MSDMNKKPTILTASGFFLLAAAALLVTALAVGALALVGVFESLSQETFSLLYTAAYYLPFLLLPAALWAGRGEGRVESLRLNPISAGTTIRIVIIALLSVTITTDISVFWMALWQKLGLNVFVSSYIRPANTTELTLSILGVSLIVPVCEELLFRGMILSAWEHRSRRSAVIASALLFAMLHGSLIGLPNQFYAGVMLALLVLWTDSIYAGVIFHGVYNAYATILNYINTGVPSEAETDALMQTDLIAAIGGPVVLIALLAEIAMLGAVVWALLRGLRMFDALRRSGAEVNERGKLVMGERMQNRLREIALRQIEDRRAGRKPAPFVPPPTTASKEKLGVAEILMLMAGVCVTLVLYGMDLLTMLGG